MLAAAQHAPPWDYDPAWGIDGVQLAVTIAAFIIALSVAIMVINMIVSARRPKAAANPWHSRAVWSGRCLRPCRSSAMRPLPSLSASRTTTDWPDQPTFSLRRRHFAPVHSAGDRWGLTHHLADKGDVLSYGNPSSVFVLLPLVLGGAILVGLYIPASLGPVARQGKAAEVTTESVPARARNMCSGALAQRCLSAGPTGLRRSGGAVDHRIRAGLARLQWP